MSLFYSVLVLVPLLLHPSASALSNRTYDNLELISPWSLASLSSAQSWCRQHGSRLAEITSEHIWNLTLRFADEFELNGGRLILNAHGEELPVWKWITGENFTDLTSYPLSIGTNKYALLSRSGRKISVEGSLPDCLQGYECRHGYVCEHTDVSKCNIETVVEIVLDGSCYIFHHDERLNWFEAYNECERNNGRLATFRNLKGKEPQIAEKLNHGIKYWIGLNRYEWRWIDSRKLITFTYFKAYPIRNHCCIYADFPSRKWFSFTDSTQEIYAFICIKNTTKCAGNHCRNGETCVGSIHNHSCECIEGGQCRTVVNKCDGNPCHNGGACSGS